ncbi:MAG: E1 protein [Varecia variegata papillomavirus 1]|nr:MAG: E1 protein [Varecia variegata papillomavirus 1]
MADDKGTDTSDSLEGGSSWYIVHEAECQDDLEDLDRVLEESTEGSMLSSFIDDVDDIDQGNSLQLFNRQLAEDCEQQIHELKRKHLTPSPRQQALLDLSPQLESVTISPQPKSSKRRLFQDSGVGDSFINESEDADTEVAEEVVVHNIDEGGTAAASAAGGSDGLYTSLLHSSNRIATRLAKFKLCFGIGWNELVRPFKSDKTCCPHWVVTVFGVSEELLESSKTLLQQDCEFVQLISNTTSVGLVALYLVEFKVSKSRETIYKLLIRMLNVQEMQLMADPPRNRSVPVALFFYKTACSNGAFKYGKLPDWIASQTLVTHQAQSQTFELSKMVQFAYDNDYTDECEIAYRYAMLAEEDANAAAWLNSNSQAKFVRDCCSMVRLYKRHEVRTMTMSQWIRRCCSKVEGEGDWTIIIKFLKYQNVNIVSFLTSLRSLLKGTPKRHCLVIWGPPDTGKSYFCSTLIRFFKGRVVSFMNCKSHFWLQPLTECKLGFLDDATLAAWNYMDTFLRNGLDGNYVSIDCKHKAPLQLKLPALLITSNLNVMSDDRYKYLHSRLMAYEFPRKCPFNADGTPVYPLTDQHWKSFFGKLQKQLDLSESEDEGEDGDPGRTFRCVARQAADPL